MAPKLTEADVLFELFLPMLCEEKAAALTAWPGSIQFHLRSDPPRVWNITGGRSPWVQRGPVPGEPDVLVTVSVELVDQLVQGREPDLDRAIEDGHLGVKGKLEVLRAFDLSMAEAKSVMQTLLSR